MANTEQKLKGQKKTLLVLLAASFALLLMYQLSVSPSPLTSYISNTCIESLSQTKLKKLKHSSLNPKTPRDKWIVTHTVGSMGETGIPGWTVLVYGPRSVKNKCNSSSCLYLQDELKKDLHFEFPPKLRNEMIAYLFAMSSGASYIFTVHRWHAGLKQLLKRFSYDEFASGIVAKTSKSEIDAATIFSVGKSLKKENASLTHAPYYSFYDYVLKDDLHPFIQCSVPYQEINTPLWKPKNKSILSLPPTFFPADTFINLELEHTLVHTDAFWALGLKQVPYGFLLIQKLLWEIEGTVGSYPRRRIADGRPKPSFDSNFLFRNPPFMDLLKHNTCKKALDIRQCLQYLMELLKEKGFIKKEDEEIVKSWTTFLTNIGYQFPRRSTKRTDEKNQKIQTFGILSPSQVLMKKSVLGQFRKVCQATQLPKPAHVIDDIALIISFNTDSLYKNIPLLEMMYRPYFTHVIFCGPHIESFRHHAYNETLGSFIFIEAFKRGWLYMFDCTMEAMKMNLNVKGFVQIGDDTLLNPWALQNLPREKIWLHTGIRHGNASLERLTPNWIWWSNGRKNIFKLFQEVKDEKKFHLNSEFETRFIENFINSSKNFTRLYIHGCDFMYVPCRLKDDFLKAANLLMKHKVMLEIGFANVALGIQSWEQIHFVEDGSLWNNRHKNKEIYRKDMIFIHPFKLGAELKDQNGKGKDFFCNKFMKGPV